MSFQTLHLHTIGALMSLQGFINNEIAKHKAIGDQYQVNHWLDYLDKVERLESDHYARYQALKEQSA